ncbi:MAG: hypothetical protein LHW41_08980 [Candidatus Cloacimonetes bacterium]|nr:hypothetical protein [Candidatus Cloacimonadota bacterium]
MDTFFGFLSALGVFLVGGFFVITVVGAPIGLGLIQLSKFLLAPYSRCMVSKKKLDIKQNMLWKTFGVLATILYIPFGLILCAVTIGQIIGLFISIIGIPLGIILAKSLGTYFNPVNKQCVPVSVAKGLNAPKAAEVVN